ncbi:septum formation initiator family protein [Glutamicibacter arilaitensis]|uniref:FtsB family cell division protein n=1 Tax=Glutamicibacter arilaitensis TaxID=256701 RepID=UPI00384E022F
MAQRPPRMPRRNTPASTGEPEAGSVDSGEIDEAPEASTRSETRGAHQAEPATDALHVIPAARKNASAPRRARPAPSTERKTTRTGSSGAPAAPRAAKPSAKPAAKTPAGKPKAPLRERAKEKQSERRRDDRVKFSAAVRRKPGEKAEAHHEPPAGEPVAAHRFSGRVAALLVVLAFFAVMLVPTVNFYRTQMTEINELRASISEKELERDELKAEIARWDDPLYIKQQARERINLVMPGEKLYKVVGELPDEEEAATSNGSTYEVRADLPWVDALLDSVHRSATD